MIDSGRTINGKKLEYETSDIGYVIYLDKKEFYRWRDPFPENSETKDYVRYAMSVINCISNDQYPEPEPTEAERFRADLDYLAAMTGVVL